MEGRELGKRLKERRLQAGIAAYELAQDVGLDASALSRIENGMREIKATELAKIADSLGISPLAILEPDSLLARLPVAARSTTTVFDGRINRRLIALAELHYLLKREGIKPSIEMLGPEPVKIVESSWLASVKQMAFSVRKRLSLSVPNHQDRFRSLVGALENHLGIDIIVEPYEKSVLGSAITDSEFPLILINSVQPRNRGLFTLAHELGHVIFADGRTMMVHHNLAGKDPVERNANAFAAELLMPENEVVRLIDRGDASPATLARLMEHFSVSWESLVYRLHNLRIINSDGRDKLRAFGFNRILEAVQDKELVEKLLQQRSQLELHTPRQLAERLKEGYSQGVVSIRPLAGVLNQDPDELLIELGSEPLTKKHLSEVLSFQRITSESSEEIYSGEAV